jgi:hypothetical protein
MLGQEVARMRRTRDLTELAGRSYWHEGDARRIVEAWRESGESVSGFAARLHLDPRRVSRWATRLERSEDAALHFHPVRVADDGPAPGREDQYIDIEIGRGRRVRVAPGVATEDLRRVLAVLDERTPC